MTEKIRQLTVQFMSEDGYYDSPDAWPTALLNFEQDIGKGRIRFIHPIEVETVMEPSRIIRSEEG